MVTTFHQFLYKRTVVVWLWCVSMKISYHFSVSIIFLLYSAIPFYFFLSCLNYTIPKTCCLNKHNFKLQYIPARKEGNFDRRIQLWSTPVYDAADWESVHKILLEFAVINEITFIQYLYNFLYPRGYNGQPLFVFQNQLPYIKFISRLK